MSNWLKVDKSDVMHVISGDGEEKDMWQLVESGEWIQDYKYQEREIILYRTTDETYWRYVESRTGSAFTEYHYEDQYSDTISICQVEKKEVTVTVWNEI